MNSDSHVLEICDLRFAYRPDREILQGVSMVAKSGQFLCLLGRNGSGKTTLLRCALRLLQPRSGVIHLDGQPLASYAHRELARRMAYVPQTATPSFAFTAGEIVLMGRLAHTGALGLAGPGDMAVALQAMTMTHCSEFSDRTLEELSGGEAQRVMVGRALAQQPLILLLDEPSSHLDLENQLLIYGMLQRVAHDWPMTVVCTSHDINLAARFADRLLVLDEGAVLADGTPAEVLRRDVLEQAFRVKIELLSAADGVPVVRAH